MSVSVIHEGSNITSNVEQGSIRWTENLTHKVDDLSLDIIGHESMPVSVSLLDEVKFYNNIVAPDALVALWRMDERFGETILDRSGNSLHGRISGATYAPTIYKYGLSIGASTGHVLVSDASDIQNIWDGGATVAWRIRPNSDGEGDDGHVFDKNLAGSDGWVVAWANDSGTAVDLVFVQEFSTTAGVWTTSGQPIPLNEYSIIELYYDSSSTSNDPVLKVNGEVVAMTESVTPVGSHDDDTGNDLYIGNRSGDDKAMDSTIDGVFIFNRQLSTAESSTLVNNWPQKPIFGGRVISYKDSVRSRGVFRRSLTCKDYTHEFDKFLFTKKYSDENVYNIIRDLLHTVNKRNHLRIADMGTDESWSGGSADTDNYRIEEQGLKFSPSTTSYSTGDLTLPTQLDFTDYEFINIDAYVDDVANFGSLRLRLGDSGLSNYYEFEIDENVETGYNRFRIPRSLFTASGSPDWTAIDDVQLGAAAAATTTVNVTFDDFYGSNTEAITMDAVNPNITLSIKEAQFSEKAGSVVLKRLADLIGYDWMIDAQKDLNFFSASNNTAPFELDDTGGNYNYESLVVQQDITKLRNRVKLFGGKFTDTSQTTENLDAQADGSNTLFQLAGTYLDEDPTTNVTLTVNAVSKTVGVAGEDDLASFDALLDKDEKTLEFASAPAAAAAVVFMGYRIKPLRVDLADSISISAYDWEQEMVIKDEDIVTMDSAIQRCQAEFTEYAGSIVEGTFSSDSNGLRAGQRIRVNSTIRGIDEWYVIQRVSGTMRTETDMVFTVDLVSATIYDVVEVMQKLLALQSSELTDYDLSQLGELVLETITVSDSVTLPDIELIEEEVGVADEETYDLDSGGDPYSYVAGNYEPSSNSDKTRTPCADGTAELAS